MHEGHRGRLIGKVKEGGIVYEHEVMEILLFNACPRKDVNAVAHGIIGRFNGMEGALNADCDDLVTVDGVGKNMAEYLAVLGKSLNAVREKDGFAVVDSSAAFRRFILSRRAAGRDCLELHCMDKDGRVNRICSFDTDRGSIAEIKDSEILRQISLCRPYGIMACRRCVGIAPPPGNFDDALSSKLFDITKLCGVKLYDYCISGDEGGYYSFKMADRGVFGDVNAGGFYE